MNIHFIAGVVYFLGSIVSVGAPLDEKVKAFEEALKTAPSKKSDTVIPIAPSVRTLTAQDLEAVIGQSDNEARVEEVVVQLMATHSSEQVQQAGEGLIQELEVQRKARATAFETRANAVLAEVTDKVVQAKKAADLDGVLKDLQALNSPQGGVSGYNQVLIGKINATFQFVTQWQDYLSAMASGNMQEAQNSLRNILNNRQVNAPMFFPRSEILARLVESSGKNYAAEGKTPEPTGTDPDVILDKVKNVDDVEGALSQVVQLPPPNNQAPFDWTALLMLNKVRQDAVVGLPVTLNLRQVMDGPVWGSNISRIVTMELLVILPYYFGTELSDPPKPDETVSAYLDRLITMADTEGNLGLLQRVIALKMALASPSVTLAFTSTAQALAGLSQDAAGQYAPAVVSYENALKDVDSFLPVKIVGERLAAIKLAHPDDFAKGLAIFMTPTPEYRGVPPWIQPGLRGNYNNYPISVLSIPMTISIPARAMAPSEAGTATNMPPVNPVSPPATK